MREIDTNALGCRAPEEFVKWGTLRQLHTMLSRCMGPHIMSLDLIMMKMLDVVKALPFTADDLHHTRNAHGTFADTLFDLADKRKAAKQKADKVSCLLNLLYSVTVAAAYPAASMHMRDHHTATSQRQACALTSLEQSLCQAPTLY